MIHTLRQQIKQRNEEKWAAVPKYIDYLMVNQRFERPTAVSIDIDGYYFTHFFPYTQDRRRHLNHFIDAF